MECTIASYEVKEFYDARYQKLLSDAKIVPKR